MKIFLLSIMLSFGAFAGEVSSNCLKSINSYYKDFISIVAPFDLTHESNFYIALHKITNNKNVFVSNKKRVFKSSNKLPSLCLQVKKECFNNEKNRESLKIQYKDLFYALKDPVYTEQCNNVVYLSKIVKDKIL